MPIHPPPLFLFEGNIRIMCCKASILEAAVIIYGTQSMFLRKQGVVPHHASAVCFPLPFVQSTIFLLVDCSVFFTPRSVNTLRGRRLFRILRSAFSRHITRVSALRYFSLFVQPTYVLFRFIRTKKGSSLIPCWRGGCLCFVCMKIRYVVLGYCVLPMGVSPTAIHALSRLFVILFPSFSRRFFFLSTVRYCSLLV